MSSSLVIGVKTSDEAAPQGTGGMPIRLGEDFGRAVAWIRDDQDLWCTPGVWLRATQMTAYKRTLKVLRRRTRTRMGYLRSDL